MLSQQLETIVSTDIFICSLWIIPSNWMCPWIRGKKRKKTCLKSIWSEIWFDLNRKYGHLPILILEFIYVWKCWKFLVCDWSSPSLTVSQPWNSFLSLFTCHYFSRDPPWEEKNGTTELNQLALFTCIFFPNTLVWTNYLINFIYKI